MNPNGQFGSNRTISTSGHPASNALSNWKSTDLIAQGVARDVAQAMRGFHERPIIDSYAVYAAYDAQNLYLGVQYVYTIWDLYGEGKQPGESKPYNMDGRLMVVFDLDPNKSVDGTLVDGNTVWDSDGQYNLFNNGADAFFLASTKPGVGTPGFFKPNANGKLDYKDPASNISNHGIKYGYADGLLPSIKNIWGQKEFGFDPELLKGETGFVDLMNEIATSAHTYRRTHRRHLRPGRHRLHPIRSHLLRPRKGQLLQRPLLLRREGRQGYLHLRFRPHRQSKFLGCQHHRGSRRS